MSAGTRPRYFVEKPQKGGGVLHYWQPSKSLKASGYKTVPLSRVRAEAIQQADALNAKVDQWKGGLPILAKNTHGTLPWLIDAYKQSPKWAKLRDSTKNGYKHYCSRILKWSAERGHPPMRTFTRRDAEQLWGSLQHTPAHAAALVKVCKLLWNYADDLDEDIVARNPFRKLDLPQILPRDQVWQPGQIAAVIETSLITPAHEQRLYKGFRSSVALAVLIAANTAQREGDILAMNVGQYDDKSITLTQSKTGMTLTIPCTAELKQALDDALFGASADGKIVQMKPRADRPILINELTGERWKQQAFQECFRKIATAAGIPDDLQFRDLRRTATVQLAMAGCEIPEIAAFGGWSIASVHQMLKVYCPLNLTMAQNGLVKLEQYRAKRPLEG